mgnify:CR=1 FL=1
MWTVVACLVPPLLLSVFVFGIQVLLITAVSVASCMAVEAASQKMLCRPVTVRDGSAALTGMLLAFVIPPGVSFLVPILGAVMAIYIGKHLLGGLGYNIFNPALLGRAFLLATFPVAMTSAWLPPLTDGAIFTYITGGVDAVSTATPLAVLKEQGMEAFIQKFGAPAEIYGSFFLGWRPGCKPRRRHWGRSSPRCNGAPSSCRRRRSPAPPRSSCRWACRWRRAGRW